MRLKITLLTLICSVAISYTAHAQHISADSVWTFGGDIALNINQTSFSNWAAGGDNAVGGNAQLTYYANRKKGRHIWDNRLELAYGVTNTESTGTRKSNDKIYLSSIYGYEIAKNLYLSGLMNFQSQFTNGYTYDSDNNKTLVSTFMAPGYLTVGAGLTWTPKSWITTTFTPVTWREVFVCNSELSDEGAYGVDVGKYTIAEAGANWQTEVNKEIMKNVKLYSRLILFSNYLDKPQNVDVNWEVQLNLTVNKWLCTYIITNLLYDDDISFTRDNGTYGAALQFKEAFGIGIQIAL